MSSMNTCHQTEPIAKELACDHHLSYAEHNTFGYCNERGIGNMSFNPTGSSIASSSDVVLSNPQSQEVLSYDGGVAKWRNTAAPAGPDATTTTKGSVQLAGDLGGTAAAPTVPGLAGKANTSHSHAGTDITSGTINIARIPTGSTGTTVSLGNHGHAAATTSVDGFMSAADKTKLDGVATGATNYSHPTGDGNLHVPATSTTNNGRVLKAGATAGSLTWGTLTASDVGAAATSHTHAAADIASGVIATARLGSGTANTTTYLRGDGAWTAPPTASDATTSTKGIVQLAGDLDGTAAAPGVAKIKGVTLPASAPSNGQVLTATGATTTTWSSPAAGGAMTPVARTTNYTATNNDFVICDATSGAITVTLPTPASAVGGRVRVLKNDASVNTVLVSSSTATLAGSNTFSVNVRWMSQDFSSDGTNWYCV